MGEGCVMVMKACSVTGNVKRKTEPDLSISLQHHPSFPHQDKTAPRFCWQREMGAAADAELFHCDFDQFGLLLQLAGGLISPPQSANGHVPAAWVQSNTLQPQIVLEIRKWTFTQWKIGFQRKKSNNAKWIKWNNLFCMTARFWCYTGCCVCCLVKPAIMLWCTFHATQVNSWIGKCRNVQKYVTQVLLREKKVNYLWSERSEQVKAGTVH